MQKCRMKVKVENFGRAGFDVYYLLESVKDGITMTIAKAKTEKVCVDYKQKKVNLSRKKQNKDYVELFLFSVYQETNIKIRFRYTIKTTF